MTRLGERPPVAELEQLQARLRALADDKAYLQLVVRLVEQLNPLPGIDDMVGGMLNSIVDTIGGTNIKLYWWLTGELHYHDFLGRKEVLASIDDADVAAVAAHRRFVEISGDAAGGLLRDNRIADSWTWIFPLLAGDELIGIIKLENVNIRSSALSKYLPIFFSHAALILSNEIRNRSRLEAERGLREKTAELDSYFNTALDLFCIADVHGNFRKLNPMWAATLGYTLADIEGRQFIELVHPDDRQETLAALQCLAEQREVPVFVNRYRHRDGSYRWIEWHSQPHGELIYAAARDITERKQAEARLELAASVFTHAQEGITIADAAGDIIEVNQAFTRITGYERDEVIGRNPRILKSGRQGPEFYAAMWQSLHQDGRWSGEIWNRRKDGEVYAELLTITAVRDQGGRIGHYVALFSDITLLKAHQHQLEHIAHYDALTGLPNRVLLHDRLRQAIAQTSRHEKLMAIVFLDLDGFKGVNDKHGHEAGDELLIRLAQRLKLALREGDTLARLGGDEFVAIITDLDSGPECEMVLSRLLRAAAAPVQLGEQTLQVSASIGVTLYPIDGCDAEILLRHADQAMYQAKLAGKNRYHLFDPEQDRQTRRRHETVEEIALALDRDELRLHYQPKVNMRSGALIGVEALLRWQHPERGLLAPGSFLPMIEDSDLIARVGDWTISAALAQIDAWRQTGLVVPVSVNIAAYHLGQPDFVARLKRKLARWPDLPPGGLELEVLETAALEDIGQVSRIIQECRQLGVDFALDDFGTGYSSLTYLKRLPATILKIDQSFVLDMLWDPEDLAIIEGVIALAAAFRRGVIAEGVETTNHGELLIRLGCDLAQGYGIARPMPPEQVPDWQRTWRPDPRWLAYRERAMSRDDLPLVGAEVDHRHWVRSLNAFIAGEFDAPPPTDIAHCRFGQWYHGEGRRRYGEREDYRRTGILHERIHELARQLIAMHRAGHTGGLTEGLQTLHALRDSLIEQLQRLAEAAP